MGSYSYICKECGKPLKGDCCNGGDNCVLIHIRHSVVEGFTKGHYNEYGGVIEENALPESERFDGPENTSINGHSEIHHSEFRLKDSVEYFIDFRDYNGESMTISRFASLWAIQDLKNANGDIYKTVGFPLLQKSQHLDELCQNIIRLYEAMKDLPEGEEKEKERGHVSFYYSWLLQDFDSVVPAIEAAFVKLPKTECDTHSGIAAYHAKCFNKAAKVDAISLVPSDIYDF